MGAIDKEATEFYSILDRVGISKERCLLSIKKGWIKVTVDDKMFFEFNRKDSFHLDERGKRVDDIIYKFKENGIQKTTADWGVVVKIIISEAAKIKS